jgi:hypothetical protein
MSFQINRENLPGLGPHGNFEVLAIGRFPAIIEALKKFPTFLVHKDFGGCKGIKIGAGIT